MGFPEAIGRAQREEIYSGLINARRQADEALDNLRAVAPHNVALNRGEYDRLIEFLVGARMSVIGAIDVIDDSLARVAREHDQDELARAEEEVNGKGA